MARTKDAAAAKEPGAIGLWTQRARGVGLLVGFAVTFLVSRGEGLPVADAALRGVIGALVMSVICWWCALMVITGLIRTALAKQNAEIAAAVAEAAATADARRADHGRPQP